MILPRPPGAISPPKALAQWNNPRMFTSSTSENFWLQLQHRLPAVDTRHVHRHVHSPGTESDLLRGGPHALPVPHVHPHRVALAPKRRDLVRRLLRPFGVYVQAGHVRPEVGEPEGDCFPEPRGRPREDGLLAVEAGDGRYVPWQPGRASLLRHTFPRSS